MYMMDDVLVHGSTREEHDACLRDVLNRLQTAGMTLNERKCQFAKTSLTFLGHVVGRSGISPDPGKVIKQPPSSLNPQTLETSGDT